MTAVILIIHYSVGLALGAVVCQVLGCFLVIRWKHWLIRGILYCALGGLFKAFIFPRDFFALTVSFLIFLVIVFIFFKDRWLIKLSAVLILYPLLVAVAYLTEESGFTIWLYVFHEQMPSFYEEMLQQGTQLLRLPIWWVIYRLLKGQMTTVTKQMTDRMWLIIDSVALSSCIGLVSVINITEYRNSYLAFPACIASVIASLGSCRLCAHIAQAMQVEMENQALRYQQSYYEELEHNQEQVRKLRHDMKNHLNVIGTFLRDRDMEQAETYYTSLDQEFEPGTYDFCSNPIVNAVLNLKYTLAVQKGIDCQVKVDFKGLLPLDDISLCSLIANSMDNAIEACGGMSHLEKRFLSIKMRCFNNFFSYEISNSKRTPILTQKDGRIVTGKADKSQHGFGLKRIREVVERYQGNLDITYTEKVFTITVLIGSGIP